MELDCRFKKGSCFRCKNCPICGCECGPSRNTKITGKRRILGEYKEESSSDDARDIPITSSDTGAHISELLTVLGLQDSTFKSTPGSKKLESLVFADVSAQEGSQAVHLVLSVLREVYNIIWSGDPDGFFRAVESQRIGEKKLLENVQAVVNALPKNSVQSNVLLTVVSRT